MKQFFTILLAVAVSATLFANADKKKSAKPKTNPSLYRKSTAKQANTIKNPHAITAKKEVEDKAATAAYKAFIKSADSYRKNKKYDAIVSSADKLISAQKKLTRNQKSYVLYFKAEALFYANKHDQAIKTASDAVTIAGDHASKHAAVAIKAAMSRKNKSGVIDPKYVQAAEMIIEKFENSPAGADKTFYIAAADFCFSQKRHDDALQYYRKMGKLPQLSTGDRALIYNGFGRYFSEKKNYKKAIAQYEAIKKIPRIDNRTSGYADINIAKCYLQLKNKEKAIEVFQSLTKHSDSRIRNTAANEVKKLTRKPAAKKAPARKKAKK